MTYINVKQAAIKLGISERSVRNYCQNGRIDGAYLVGKTWYIPENVQKPSRKISKTVSLAEIIAKEKKHRLSGGIYHSLMIEFTYNSNHIEGSRLSHDQTRYIFETNTVGIENGSVNVDDVIETVNHFRCIDYVIDNYKKILTENFVKKLHYILKSGTQDSLKEWFNVGGYKKLPNQVGGNETVRPEKVGYEIKKLISEYNSKNNVSFDDILNFHAAFEKIHPFQDGNGRVGRLVMLKECLKHDIVPFIIDDELKYFYYRGLAKWSEEKGYLIDTCYAAQDKFKKLLDYYKIKY